MVKPGYKQTEIGVIPEDWDCVKIGNVASVLMCKRIFADQTSDHGEIPFYKIGTFGKQADAFISRTLYNEYKNKFSFPKEGDVLLSAAGTLGRTVVYDGKDAYFQDSNIVWLDIDKRVLCNEYLNHYYRVIKWMSSEGSTISRLYNGIICGTNIVIPPLPEQKRIAEALSDVDELISSLEKLIAKKKAVKQGAMQELLTGKKRLPGFTGGWDLMELGKYGSLIKETINPQFYSSKYFWEYSMPAFDGNKSPNKQIGMDMHSNRTVIDGKVLLFNKLNVRQKRIWLVEQCRDNAVCSSEFLAYRSNVINLELLVQILNTDKVTMDFVGMSTGTSNSQKRIIPNDFLEYKVYLPLDKKEQEAIADVFSSMDNEIEALEQKLAKIRRVKQGMMQQLLTGKIRLNN